MAGIAAAGAAAAQTISIISDSIGAADKLYDFVEKFRGQNQAAFVKDLANIAYYAGNSQYNVMVKNLGIPDPPVSSVPQGVVHYSSVQAFHTTYATWVFSGSAKFDCMGYFGHENWCGIGRLQRLNPDGTPNQSGQIMEFYAR